MMIETVDLLLELIKLTMIVTCFMLVAISFAILTMGKLIEDTPTDYEDTRKKTLASPETSTQIVVITLWAINLIGMYVVFSDISPSPTIRLIIGITATVTIYLLAFTTLLFTLVCYNKIIQTEREKVTRRQESV